MAPSIASQPSLSDPMGEASQPAPSSQAIDKAAKSSHVLHMNLNQAPMRAERAEGCYIYGPDGKRWLDACGGAVSQVRARTQAPGAGGWAVRRESVSLKIALTPVGRTSTTCFDFCILTHLSHYFRPSLQLGMAINEWSRRCAISCAPSITATA